MKTASEIIRNYLEIVDSKTMPIIKTATIIQLLNAEGYDIIQVQEKGQDQTPEPLSSDVINWSGLQRKFYDITVKAGGPTKTGSGGLEVSYNYSHNMENDQEITVQLLAYDIVDWSRHTYLGPFVDEKYAYQIAYKKVMEAEKLVDQELKEDQQ